MARLIGDYEVVHGSSDLTRDAYLARAPSGQQVVAALFQLDERARRALGAEVQRTQQLRHPAFTRVHDVFVHEGMTAVALEHVTGVTLSMLLEHLNDEEERIADGAAMHITRELVGALIEGHRATGKGGPLVHPRLEPDQVVVTWDGAVKLVGIGLGPIYRVAAERHWWSAPLQSFAAPEVRSGSSVKPAANLYSAALMLWSLLAQKHPPERGRPPSLSKLRPDVDANLVRALDGALAPVPSTRFVSEQKLVQFLSSRVTENDREELRWNMEVLRAMLVVDDLVCATALPPTRKRIELASLPPGDAPDAPSARDSIPSSVEPTRRHTTRPFAPTGAETAPDPRVRLDSERSSDADMSTPRFQRLEEPKPRPISPPIEPVIGFVGGARKRAPLPEVFAARAVLIVTSVAVTVAFAAGVMVGRLTSRAGATTAPTTSSAAEPSPSVAPPPSAPSAASTPPPLASAAAPSASVAEPAPSIDVPALQASAAELAPNLGMLIVEPKDEEAFVYVGGRHVGKTGEPVMVPCGARFVRLGTYPLGRWLGRGRAIKVKCRNLTRLTLE